MRLPRDVSGDDLIKRLKKFGYESVRQTGSHVRLTCHLEERVHHITIPRHMALRVGTLSGILNDVAKFLRMSKEELLKQLF
ncbi:MAG: type II toxin-antitoxin system HicA family toxin [Anaerolineae bacterium]